MALAILGICAPSHTVGQKRVKNMAKAAQIHAEERTQRKHLLGMGEWCLPGGLLTLIARTIRPTNVNNKTSHPKDYWVF